MKNKILKILLLLLAIFIVTACGDNATSDDSSSSKKQSSSQKDKDNNTETTDDEDNESDDEEDKKDTTSYLELRRIYDVEDYVDGYLPIHSAEVGDNTTYLLNNKFAAVYKWTSNLDNVGGYMITYSPDEKDMMYIYDSTGKEVFTYKKRDYEDVKLVNNGYLFLKKQIDTYNTSETTIGVYSLKEQKYIVEPSSSYTNFYECGDDMYQLDDDKKLFFNSRLGKVITFSESAYSEFSAGYAISIHDNKLEVFKDDGTYKEYKYEYESSSYNIYDTAANGYFIDTTGEGDSQTFKIVNLDTGAVTDISKQFYRVANHPRFTKDGYALILMVNQSVTPYYTVIDTTGKMLFEPVKYSNSNSFTGGYDKELLMVSSDNLTEGNYIIFSGNPNIKDQVRDYNNKMLCEAEEDETFVKIVNNAVVVRHPTNLGEEYYFKDMQGNRIKIKDKLNN